MACAVRDDEEPAGIGRGREEDTERREIEQAGLVGEPTRADGCAPRRRAAPCRSDVARLPGWQEEPIGRHHDRGAFDCGDAALDEYPRRYAHQNHESGGAKTFVAASLPEPARVLGYCTISPGSIEFPRVPADLTKRLGRHGAPAFRLGRLAVDRSAQDQGPGGDLLMVADEWALGVAAEVGGGGSPRPCGVQRDAFCLAFCQK